MDIQEGKLNKNQVILNIQNIQRALEIDSTLFKTLDEKSLEELEIQQKELLILYRKSH